MLGSRTPRGRKRAVAAAALAAVVAAVSAGCGIGRTDEGMSKIGIVTGTTDRVFSLDPAAAYDNGSLAAETQIYQYLLNFAPNADTVSPDAAQKCEFTDPKVYTCTLKPGLTFANGHPLTAKSVKFSMDRMVGINDPNGPASLLANLDKTEVVNDRTVAFTLKLANDQTFPSLLATQIGPIVDEQVFPADRIMSDDEVVAAKGYSGPYTIASYDKNKLIEYQAFPDYQGILGKPSTERVATKYYATSDNMKLDLQNGALDLGYRSFSPTDVESLRGAKNLTVHEGPGGELRYIVFNLKTMPGSTPEQKLAIRKAVSAAVDRKALANNVYKQTYEPAYSFIPDGVPGATEPIADLYGTDTDTAQAAGFLQAAGVQTPVELNLQYNPDHYGPSSSEEYAAVKAQLEASGLFKVNLQSTEWVTYQKERASDTYPLYQLGWFPDFPDADNYVSPFFGPNNFLQSHFEEPSVTERLNAEVTQPDKQKRMAQLGELQHYLAENYMPIVPLLSGKLVAIADKDVQGVVLDASSKMRYSTLSK